MWQWMKHRSPTLLQSQIGTQLSWQRQVKVIQSNQRRKHQQARFWPPYFGMYKELCSLITLRKEEPSIENIIYHYWCIWRKKSSKNDHKWRRKSVLSPRQCTDCNDGRTRWIAFQTASTPTLFSRSSPQRVLAVSRPQKMLQGKRFDLKKEVISETEVYFETKDKLSNKKRHWIVREALESVYHHRKRLCWWIKSNFASKLLFY